MSEQYNNTLKLIKRNEHGLIEGLEYKFSEDGTINWKAMIPSEFLYVNPDLKKRDRLEKKYGKSYAEIKPIEDNVEDVDLVQLLGAAKFLLRIYGYNAIHYNVIQCNESYAAVNCRIDFIGNYLSQMRPISFEDNASASLNTTNGFGQKYLIEMATNRAFVRCLRNFMGINIVSREEISGNDSQTDEYTSPQNNQQVDLLIAAATKRNYTFLQIQKKLMMEKYEGAEKFKDWHDIPKEKVFELINRLKSGESNKI